MSHITQYYISDIAQYSIGGIQYQYFSMLQVTDIADITYSILLNIPNTQNCAFSIQCVSIFINIKSHRGVFVAPAPPPLALRRGAYYILVRWRLCCGSIAYARASVLWPESILATEALSCSLVTEALPLQLTPARAPENPNSISMRFAAYIL